MSNFDLIEIPRSFDSIICLNADLPDPDFIVGFDDTPIICADGAANRIIEMGITPDFVVGDLDSIEQDYLLNDIEIIQKPDQDTNDFEKCLTFATDIGFQTLLILGMHGGELEHTLNNWSVLMKYMKKLNLWVYDKERIGFPIDKSFKIDCKKNEIISLIPQPEVKLSTQNFQWNLDNETLTLGSREGARNRANDTSVEIEMHSGSLFVFKEYQK